MSVYWEHTYDIKLSNKSTHHVVIYDFSPNLLFLRASDEFSLSFSRDLEDTGGNWNSNLKLDDGKVHPGWLFSKEEETVSNLFSLLKKIHTGDVKPEVKDLKKEEEMKKMCNSIFSDLFQIFEKMTKEKEICVIPINSPGEGVIGETHFYFNRNEGDFTKGDCVVKLQKGKKLLEIYQTRN